MFFPGSWRYEAPPLQLAVEKLSILNPTPPPEERDPLFMARIAVATVIAVVVCIAAVLLNLK
jgi:hypothetical protein